MMTGGDGFYTRNAETNADRSELARLIWQRLVDRRFELYRLGKQDVGLLDEIRKVLLEALNDFCSGVRPDGPPSASAGSLTNERF